MSFEKRKPYRNKKITQSANGENCTVGFVGCENKTETTVFCHLNESFAGKGMSQKADDCAGFYGCDYCHGVYDRRIKSDINIMEMDWWILRAYYRTIRRLIDKGILK